MVFGPIQAIVIGTGEDRKLGKLAEARPCVQSYNSQSRTASDPVAVICYFK